MKDSNERERAGLLNVCSVVRPETQDSRRKAGGETQDARHESGAVVLTKRQMAAALQISVAAVVDLGKSPAVVGIVSGVGGKESGVEMGMVQGTKALLELISISTLSRYTIPSPPRRK